MPPKGKPSKGKEAEEEVPQVDYAAKAESYSAFLKDQVNPTIYEALTKLEEAVEYDLDLNLLERPSEPLVWIGTYLESQGLLSDNGKIKAEIGSLQGEVAELQARVESRDEGERRIAEYWASFDSVPTSWKEEQEDALMFSADRLERCLPAAADSLQDRDEMWRALVDEEAGGVSLDRLLEWFKATSASLEQEAPVEEAAAVEAPAPSPAPSPAPADVEFQLPVERDLFRYGRSAIALALGVAIEATKPLPTEPAAVTTEAAPTPRTKSPRGGSPRQEQEEPVLAEVPVVIPTLPRSGLRLFAVCAQSALVYTRIFQAAGHTTLVRDQWKALLPSLNKEIQRHTRTRIKPKDFARADTEANDQITTDEAVRFLLSLYAENKALNTA